MYKRQDVVDCSIAALSGLTSQPNLNSMVAMMQGHDRECPLNLPLLNQYSAYWEDVREYYYPFESGMKSGSAEVYDNEVPGGQFSNLRQQAISLGVGEQFETLKKNYITANRMFGDVVKVTPSSKVVGDMAIFMTANHLTEADVLEKGENLSFPESVKGFMKGELGQPVGGFPGQLQQLVLKGETPMMGRPNDHLQPVDLSADFEAFKEKFPNAETYLGEKGAYLDYLSYKMYPQVYTDFYQMVDKFGEVVHLPTPAFFYGLKQDEEILVMIEAGKTVMIKLLYVSEPDEAGQRTVTFDLNGQARRILVKDNSFRSTRPANEKVSREGQIGSPLQGRLVRIQVKPGDTVKKNQPLFVIEAMKMESIVSAPAAGEIKEVVLKEGSVVEQDDWVLSICLLYTSPSPRD